MKLSLSILQEFIDLHLPAQEIAETLTLLGIEVDAITDPVPSFAQVVVGEVLSAQKHSQADHLQVTEVTDGKQTYTVVCGALNCRKGIKTAFAKVGAVLTDRDGLQRKIEKTSIRGVESFGMLCSASELGIGEDHEGILELPEEISPGTDLTNLLWDPLFEISLTPNLGHCMSALGVARELSAALHIPLREQTSHLPENLPPFPVEVSTELCARYLCALVEDLSLKNLPFKVKTQLERMGQNTIHPIVDITNYLQIKLGNPLHAFDADLIEGNIRVEKAKKPFSFLCLDGVEREVPKDALIIADEKKPLAIAGVMGGANSSVSEKTTRVLLEAALFDPISIRKTSKAMGLRTDSSLRFEKGVDRNTLPLALSLAVSMLQGSLKAFQDIQKKTHTLREIPYRTERVNQILGLQLSETEVEEILLRLQIQTRQHQAIIPSFRYDLTQEIDLVEEVARIYGYHNIEKKEPLCHISKIPNDPVFLFEKWVRNQLVKSSLSEFLCSDLISPSLADTFQEIHVKPSSRLRSTYSKSEEYSVLRTSLLPGLLQAAKGNFSQKNQNIAAFEVGRIHFLEQEKAIELPMIGILLCGEKTKAHWSHPSELFDFFDLKAIVENLVQASYIPSHHLSFHPGRQADLMVEGHSLGALGQLHPHLLAKFDINRPIFYAEIHLLDLMKAQNSRPKMQPLALFPSSERDLTLPLALKTPIESVFAKVRSFSSALLEKVELIDLYLPEGGDVKNATFRFTYRDPLKTTSFKEVELEHSKITKLLAK